MKILIVTYEFPPLLGGAGIYAQELAIGLSRLGHMIKLVTAYHGKEEYCKSIDISLFESKNIEVNRFTGSNFDFYINIHRKITKTFGKSFENSFDLIFLVDARATRYSLLFFNRAKLSKSIHFFHGSEYYHFIKEPNIFNRIFLYSGRTGYAMKKSKAIITVSAQLKENWKKRFPFLKDKIHHVLNGVDENLFSPKTKSQRQRTRSHYNLSNSDFVIMSASRLIKEKGQDLLLKATPELLKQSDDTKILIAGDGKDRRYLEDLVSLLGIENHVSFLGKIDRETLADLLAASDLFVLPSRIPYEGFGLVYIEANACGIPVISGNTGGVVDAVAPMESGMTIDPTRVEDLCDALIKMLDDDFRIKMGKSSLKRVLKSFTNKIMAERILKNVKIQ